MSIITPEAKTRCELEAKRIADLRTLRELQIATALSVINKHYDALERGEEPPQLGRRIFDRRSNSWPPLVARFSNDRRDNSWSALAQRFTSEKL